MAGRKRSTLEEERMTDANITKVIQMLENPPEGEKPWTKKECCQFLGMTYNTTRLGTIIENFKSTQERTQQRRKELRGKPVSADDVVFIISEYLGGETIDSISKSTYRSPGVIKRILEANAVPIRVPGSNYFTPELIPDDATRERFALGEVVYSARYDSLAKITSEQLDPKYGYVYRVWLMSESWLQSAYQEAYELASLEHLRKLGVKV
jgi:hypothetical protein